MAKQNQSTKTKNQARKIDVYFNRLDASHQNQTNRLLHYFFVPLMVLGVLGLAWAVPFPHIGFIGVYNGYFNWASFVIAFAIYFYLKLSPLLSYFALFLFFGLSYAVMQLVGPGVVNTSRLGLISAGILVVSIAGQYLGSKAEGNKASFTDDMQLAAITPLWVLYSLTKRLGLRY